MVFKFGLSILILFQLGQVHSFGTAFNTADDVRSSIGCLRSQFNAALFLVQVNNQISQIGCYNYQCAQNFYPPWTLEAYVQLSTSISGKEQFYNFWHNFGQYTPYKSVWVDLTDDTKWSNNAEWNAKILDGFLAYAWFNYHYVGIYTNKAAHEKIIGPNKSYAWYVRVWYQGDATPNMNDFVPFNGIRYPTVKQVQKNDTSCGTSVNSNIYNPAYFGKETKPYPATLKFVKPKDQVSIFTDKIVTE